MAVAGVGRSPAAPALSRYSNVGSYGAMTSRRPPISPSSTATGSYKSSSYSSTSSPSYTSSTPSYTPAPSTYVYRTRHVSRDRCKSPGATTSGVGSTYGSSSSSSSASRYGGSTTPSPSSRRTYSPLGGTSGSGRPLPPGKGPLDSTGRRFDYNESRAAFRRAESLPSSTRGPVKADHSTRFKDRTSSYDRSDDVTSPSSYPTGRLSRSKRTNSYTDLTNGVGSLSIRDSKRYGSSRDVTNGLGSSERTSREEAEDLFGVRNKRHSSVEPSALTGSGGRRVKTHTETIALNQENGFGHSADGAKYGGRILDRLPDIATNNKTSRSPSLDRGASSDRDDLDSPSGKRRPGVGSSALYASGSRTSGVGTTNGSRSEHSSNSRGLVGLKNLGNTCFMNSVIQCLSNTSPLLEYCQDPAYVSDVNKKSSMKGSLVKAFANLMNTMWKSNADNFASPTEFKGQIARFAKRFVGYNQQDAQEFLIYLLEGLHEDLNRVQDRKKRVIDDSNEVETISASTKSSECWKRYLDHDNSKIVDIFVGQLKSVLTCTVCGYESNTFDPFWDISLPLKKYSRCDVTIQGCLELFTQEEVLDGDEKPTCAKCKKRQKCTKRFTIQKFPKILILHLKRFNHESMYRSKLSTCVKFPLKGLDLTPFCAETGAVSPTYNLYAVSNHSGTPMGGHYTAYARNPYSGQWHHFSDMKVIPVSESTIVSSEAYVLCYELTNGRVARL